MEFKDRPGARIQEPGGAGANGRALARTSRISPIGPIYSFRYTHMELSAARYAPDLLTPGFWLLTPLLVLLYLRL